MMKNTKNIRTYSELIKLKTFTERFEYLKLDGEVGKETFGYDRYLNQILYRSPIWKQVRAYVIIRDNGCDLGIEGRELNNYITVHHMNPISKEQILNNDPDIFNPEYLITTDFQTTHKALHYGDEDLLRKEPITRSRNDTCPWK